MWSWLQVFFLLYSSFPACSELKNSSLSLTLPSTHPLQASLSILPCSPSTSTSSIGSSSCGVAAMTAFQQFLDVDEEVHNALLCLLFYRNWQHHSCCVKYTGGCLPHDCSSRHSLRHILYAIHTCIFSVCVICNQAHYQL